MSIADEHGEEIVKLYNEGYTGPELGKMFGVTYPSIYNVLRKFNIPRRGDKFTKKHRKNMSKSMRRYSPEERKEVAKLYVDDGLSTPQISEKTGISKATVYRILKEDNVPIRKFNEMVGEKHPLWKGGISFEPYCTKFNDEFKVRVRSFWGNNCGICGKNQEYFERKLSVHHVNYNKMSCCDNTIPLFIPLCSSCHGKTSNKKDVWEPILTEYIMNWFNGESFYPQNYEGG